MQDRFRMDFVGAEVTQHMTQTQKIELLLEKILNNVIVVLQEDLNPNERAELIKQVMLRINRNFYGIELFSLRKMGKRTSFWWKKEERGLTIIAPSNLVEILNQEGNRLCLLLGNPSTTPTHSF